MNQYCQEVLNKKFQEMRSRNPNFSVRAFARHLGLQPSATNEILKGQRRISKVLAQRIAESLRLDPEERSQFLRDFDDQNSKRPETAVMNAAARKLTADQFQLISNWIHFAILALIKVPDFQSDVGWIARRFGVETPEVRKALLRLQHLDLIRISADGEISRTATAVRTTDDVLNMSLQEMHLNDLQLAARKLKEIPVELRDFTNLTISANPKHLARAKEILRRTQDELEECLVKDGEEVYRLCMYLFPLTVSKENV